MSKNVAVVNYNGKILAINVHSDDYELAPNELLVTNPAYIDGDYVNGYFYPKQPFESWVRDGLGNWNPPVSMPEDGKRYRWNEELGNWEEIVEEVTE